MASRQATRRLAAIVATDFVGYSRLLAENETATLDAMKAHRRVLWTPKIDAYGGLVVGTAGDSIVVEFQSAVAAVECSFAVQRGMAERNVGLPEDRRMLLRVGTTPIPAWPPKKIPRHGSVDQDSADRCARSAPGGIPRSGWRNQGM